MIKIWRIILHQDGDNGFNKEQEAFGRKASEQLLLEQEAVLGIEEVV